MRGADAAVLAAERLPPCRSVAPDGAQRRSGAYSFPEKCRILQSFPQRHLCASAVAATHPMSRSASEWFPGLRSAPPGAAAGGYGKAVAAVPRQSCCSGDAPQGAALPAPERLPLMLLRGSPAGFRHVFWQVPGSPHKFTPPRLTFPPKAPKRFAERKSGRVV